MRIAFIGAVIATSVSAAQPTDARVEVARLDGAPVYHWRVFHSRYGDDVDRALIVREFHRRGYNLPQRLVTEALAEQVTKQFGGNEQRLADKLKHEHVTLQDYREFIAEEITLDAMLNREAEHNKSFSRDRWLAALRKQSRVERRQ